jgi:outer membrane protein assembly factor BamB
MNWAPSRFPDRRTRRLSFLPLEDRSVPSTVWPQRGGDAGHTGYVNVSVNAAQIDEAWSQPITYLQRDSDWDRNGNRELAIDDARVYRTELEGPIFDGNYHVMAFDLATGAPVWDRVFVGYGGSVSAPSVADGYLYVNRGGHSGTSSSDEERPWLYQLDPATGATVTRATYAAQWGSDERPTIAGNQLVTHNGYEGGMGSWSVPGLAANWAVDGSIYHDPEAALSATSIYAYGDPTLDESYTKVYARATGEVEATLTHPLNWTFDPVVSGSGRVLVSVGPTPHWPGWRGVAAYGPAHDLLWNTETSTDVIGKAVGNGVVAVTTRTHLYLLNEATGAVLWTWEAPRDPIWVPPLLTRTIILTRTHVFVATDGDVYGASIVYAFNLATGRPEWSYQNEQADENASTRLEMALGGGRLIIGHDGFVKAFDLFGAADDTAVTNEDRPVRIRVLANDTNPDGQPLTVTAVGPAAHGTVIRRRNGTITYRPAPDYNGPDSFTYTIRKSSGITHTAEVRVTVRPVNDAPTFTRGPSQTVAEDSGPATIPGWATDMSPGPADEAGQGLSFRVTTTRPRLFAVPPAVAPDGTLTFTPAANANGKARVTVRLKDDGGRAYGGRDTSPRRTFTITVTPVPDVARVVVNRGAAQRSRVTDFAVTFDTVVDPVLLAEAFALTRTDGTSVGAVLVTSSVSLGRTTARLQFSGDGTEAGSLADGLWTLRVRADRVLAGGTPMAADYTSALHRLFGDADGDRDVDGADEVRFNASYGSRSNQLRYRSHFDWDQDIIGPGLRFLQRLGTSI